MRRAREHTPTARPTRRRRRGGLALAIAAAIVACLALACSAEDEETRATELGLPDRAVDEELMLALSQAKSYHHKADIFLKDDEPELAERALRQLLDVPFPEMSPEAEDIRLDARARLGALLLDQGETDEALDVVREGIEAAERESFFLANLYTVKGEIFETRAAELGEGAGDEEGEAVEEARRRALEAYAESIAINETLQQELMQEGSP